MEPHTASTYQDAARTAALASSGIRRRRPTIPASSSSLEAYENLPWHLQDNPHIRRFYRSPGNGLRKSFRSLFSLHNETGNIYTHLLGFLVFVFLTTATAVWVQPAPLLLGRGTLASIGQAADITLHDLMAKAGAWERAARRAGLNQLDALEEALRGLRLSDVILEDLPAALEEKFNEVKNGSSSLVSQIEYGISHLEHKLTSMGASAAHDIEGFIAEVETAVHKAVATALDATWPVKRWPVYVFTAGAMICMLVSSICHLFGCCAAHIATVIWRFDYAGIAILIVTSFYPPVYYGFMCWPALRLFYLVTTTLLGVCTLPVTLLPVFQTPGMHKLRAGIFVALGLWGVVPIMHGAILHRGVPEVTYAIGLDIIMGAVYLLGAAVYATRVPERWKPGAFDLAFHSHQLFHVAVVVAACIHYKATLVLMRWRDATGGCMGMLNVGGNNSNGTFGVDY